MSLPVPIAVVLKTPRACHVVTDEIRDLSMRNTVPGGYANVRLQLASGARLPLSTQPDDIDYYGLVTVYDTQAGEVVGQGRIEDLGKTAGPDGQVWDLGAVGPAAHTEDISRSYVPVDRLYSQFKESSINKPYAHWVTTNDDMDPGGGLQVSVPRGTHVSIGPVDEDVADMLYQAINYAGQKVARVRVEWDIGFTDTAWILQVITKTGPTGTKVVACSQTASPAGGSLLGKLTTDGGNIVLGNNCVTLRARHTGVEQTIPDDLCWFQFNDWSVKAVLFDQTGAEITSGYGGDTYTADQIVTDIVARFLPKYDLAGASIAVGSYGIDQCAYYDPTTPRKMFEDLMLLEASAYWAAWEANAAGLNRFEWKVWDTAVSYEADVSLDAFEAPSTAADLYNAARVRYQTTNGTIKNLQRTSSVAQLTAAGLTREWPIDLGDNIGSTANAAQAGDVFLADHQYPPNAGRITIARPIVDLQTGRMVPPQQLKSGKLMRVNGINPYVDSLNPVGRNGVTVFRVRSVDYQASSAAAQCELDTYSLTTARALAQLARQPALRRR
jgi:hypothetical protein